MGKPGGMDLLTQAFSLSGLLKVDIMHSLIGGAIVLVIGVVLQAIISFKIPLINWSVWKIISYVNPICLFKGFKKCDSSENKALAVMMVAYLIVIVLYVAAISAAPEFAMQIFNLFPPLPFLIGMGVGLVSWYLLKSYGQKWSVTKKIVNSGITFPLVCLGLSVGTLPLVLLIVKLVKRHSNHPAYKYGGDVDRMREHHEQQMAELASDQHTDHTQMIAHHYEQGTLPPAHQQQLQQAHATGGTGGLAGAIGGLANSALGRQLGNVAQNLLSNPETIQMIASAL